MEILMDFCRLCQENRASIPIKSDLNFIEAISKLTDLNVDDESAPLLPPNICSICEKQIKEMNDFIEKLGRVDKKLRSILNFQQENPSVSLSQSIETVGRYECPICLKSFRNEKGFRSHKKKHPELHCLECNKLFKEVDEKTGHKCDKSNNEDLFECEICQKKFKAKSNLRIHIKTHSVGFNCSREECSKVFTSSYALKIHIMYDHDGNQRYLCVICGKKFNTKNSLNCHEKIHLDVKEYSCKLCDINFSVRSNLRAHEKKHHEGVRFYCSKCSKCFITKCSLDRHEKIHIGVKEYTCDLCTSAFYTNKELLKHKRYHEGIRQHKCDQCFKTFFERHHLVVHLRSHTGERPYGCKVPGCGKSFMDGQKLKRHHLARHSTVG